MSRPKIYIPVFEGPVQGWAMNFIRANYWRVQSSMEFEDCTQEAHYMFLRLASKYGVMDTPQHFMSLYKISFTRYFHDLSTSDTKLKACISYDASYNGDEENHSRMIDSLLGELDNAGGLVHRIMSAPEEVRTVLNFILNGPHEIVETVCSHWCGSIRKQEAGNKYVCQLLGIPHSNVWGNLLEYFDHS